MLNNAMESKHLYTMHTVYDINTSTSTMHSFFNYLDLKTLILTSILMDGFQQYQNIGANLQSIGYDSQNSEISKLCNYRHI